MCDTPAGARPSGSNSNSAKLFVPSGTPDQASGGDTFSPTQFGVRCVSAHAFLTASVPLSCSCGDVRVSTSAALALRDRAKLPASTTVPSAYFIAFSSPLFVIQPRGPRHMTLWLCRRDRGRVERCRRGTFGWRHRRRPPWVLPCGEEAAQARHDLLRKELRIVLRQLLPPAAALQAHHQVPDVEVGRDRRQRLDDGLHVRR